MKIASRRSSLALTQTNLVRDALLRSGRPSEVLEIITTGDRKQNTPLAADGDKRDWIYELELAVVAGEADFALHSGKDIPAEIHPETALISVLPSADAADIFIGRDSENGRIAFAALPPGSVIGTASLRRRAQLLRRRPDLQVVPHRGNVPTRIQKLHSSTRLSGIILAAAGVNRLGIDEPRERISAEMMIPAVNQGILVAQCRHDRPEIASVLHEICHPETELRFQAERACVELLRGDCNSAIGLHCQVGVSELLLRCEILLPDGSDGISEVGTAPRGDPRGLGRQVAESLLSRGAEAILERSRELRGTFAE